MTPIGFHQLLVVVSWGWFLDIPPRDRVSGGGGGGVDAIVVFSAGP